VGGTFLAASSALGSVPAVLTPLIASAILLAVRAWIGVTGVPLSRRVSLLLDVVITILGVLFLTLVIVRFRTIG